MMTPERREALRKLAIDLKNALNPGEQVFSDTAEICDAVCEFADVLKEMQIERGARIIVEDLMQQQMKKSREVFHDAVCHDSECEFDCVWIATHDSKIREVK